MKSLKWPLVVVIALSVSAVGWASEECAGHGGSHEDEHNEVLLNKNSQELVGIKTINAKLSSFTRRIAVVGQIAQDPEATVNVPAPVSGTVARCAATVGSIVKKGDLLCVVDEVGSGAQVEVRSPIDGVVIGGCSKPGERVDGVSSLHMIADFSALPATFDVYEKDIKDVKIGQKICARSIAYPDACFDGEITFISPRVERETNTIKVRAVIRNPENLLKLGMFVSAEIAIESPERYIVLPLEAVQCVGEENMVFVKAADEKFEAREVTVADRSGGEVAVSNGITEGETVVTENGFLLKSELLKSKMGAGCAD